MALRHRGGQMSILKGVPDVDVVALAIFLSALSFIAPPSSAQVGTNITSSGLGTAVNGSTSTPCLGGTCNITGGTQRGSNLFHSFGLLNVGAGVTRNFCNGGDWGYGGP